MEPLKLSPSSVTDFKSCPQLFKYRAIDRLPEPVSGPAAKGSLVHAVLERYDGERRKPHEHIRNQERTRVSLPVLVLGWVDAREPE